jgi:hypothetical protein
VEVQGERVEWPAPAVLQREPAVPEDGAVLLVLRLPLPLRLQQEHLIGGRGGGLRVLPTAVLLAALLPELLLPTRLLLPSELLLRARLLLCAAVCARQRVRLLGWACLVRLRKWGGGRGAGGGEGRARRARDGGRRRSQSGMCCAWQC